MIIKIDKSNVFNSTCRSLTLDILSGRASHDYDCDLKQGHTFSTRETLSNMFGYFKSMCVYHDQTVAYTDDGYIKSKLSVTLQVLFELNRFLKEDTGLELNVVKTSVLPLDGNPPNRATGQPSPVP